MKKLFGTLVAVGVMALMAVGVQAATYSAGVASPEAGIAEVPVLVTPAENETESVNGYVVTFTYDSTKVTPVVAGTDATGADCYAEVGTAFAEDKSVLVSDIVATEGSNQTLAVAWAGADAVSVSEATELANVDFQVADTATGVVPVSVQVVALANDGNALAEDGTYVIADGEITIDAEDFLRGDANGDGVVDIDDAARVAQYLLKLSEIKSEHMLQADANNDGAVDIDDAARIAQYLLKLAEIPE